MTDPIVRLDTPQISVLPGGQGRTEVTLRNLSPIVEGFRLEVLGERVSEWAQVTPADVRVLPGKEATAWVVFSPPEGTTTRSGTFPFAVRAESIVDPQTSALAEGDLEIGRVFGLQPKLSPTMSSGRWRGRHSFEITNAGNTPIQLKLSATDPAGRLAFLLGPDALSLPVGETGEAQLRVRTRKPFLRGTQTPLPFKVVAEPDLPDTPIGSPPLPTNPQTAISDGTFVQRPILSKVTVVLATVAVVAVAGLAAFALTRGPGTDPGGLTPGPPQAPTLAAASNDATSVRLLWKSQPNVDGYQITQLDAAGSVADVKDVDGALEVSVVEDLDPGTPYCFQLAAVRGDQTSQPSNKACTTTDAAPPVAASASPAASAGEESTAASAAESSAIETVSGQPVPGPVVVPPTDGQPPASGSASSAPASGAQSGSGTANFAPNQFIDVLKTYLANDALALSRAQVQVQQYATQGISASILRTTDFPQLELIKGSSPVDSYLVYIGPFADQQEAKSACPATSVAPFCQSVQPSPAG